MKTEYALKVVEHAKELQYLLKEFDDTLKVLIDLDHVVNIVKDNKIVATISTELSINPGSGIEFTSSQLGSIIAITEAWLEL